MGKFWLRNISNFRRFWHFLLFIRNIFFSTQFLCSLTFLGTKPQSVGWVLLNTYKHHHTEALFTGPFLHLVYVRPCLDGELFNLCNPFFFFTMIIINQIISIKIDTLAFLQFFLEYALLFLEIKRKKKKEQKANNFLEANVQPQGVA